MRVLAQARQVSRSVADRQILAPVTFDIAAGTCTAVTGPNGSGKTTLLRLVLGRDEPSSGEMWFDRALLAPRDVAAVLQPPPFYDNLTVAEHLVFVQGSWGVRAGRDDALAWLDALGIRHIADTFPDELSSGERQLVSLSFALIRPAGLIVLDEPEQRLDVERRALIRRLLAARRDAGQAVLMATHDPAFVSEVADAVVELTVAGA